MNRRKFLQVGALTGAGWLVGDAMGAVGGEPGGAGAPPTPARKPVIAGRQPGAKLKLSCTAYSFRKELSGKRVMSLVDFIDFCAHHGLDATELTSYYFRAEEQTPEYFRMLRRRAYVNGLDISGTPIRNNFCLPPGAPRDKEIAHVKKWIDHVGHLGSQTIRVFAGNTPRGATEEQARGWAVEAFKEAAQYASERGVLLALENHGGITSTADQLLRLVRGVDSPWFGVNLDTGNFVRDGYRDLAKAAPYAVAVQVKVEIRDAAGKRQPADFKRLIGILTEAGYRGYVALEYEAKEPAKVAVPRYLEELRKAMG